MSGQRLEKADPDSRRSTLEFTVLDDPNAHDLGIWLDRELNILVGRWIEFTTPMSVGHIELKLNR